MAGSMLISAWLPAMFSTRPATYSFAPRASVIDFSVHANVNIRIAGTMLLNPSGIALIHSLKFNTLVTIIKIIVITNATTEPYTRPTDASEFENASTKLSPSKKPPV